MTIARDYLAIEALVMRYAGLLDAGRYDEVAECSLTRR